VSKSSDADDLAERISDSLLLDLDIALGIRLIPRRLENRKAVRARSLRRRGRVAFPRNSYPHAPTVLYQAGREAGTAPLIRYWSFYQVLEYFFPQYNQAETLRQLSRLLRSPSFNPHIEDFFLKPIDIVGVF
jgi:hypothetical protein